jgi:predicted  nucleic acid-binding Zn-ribbon protein
MKQIRRCAESLRAFLLAPVLRELNQLTEEMKRMATEESQLDDSISALKQTVADVGARVDAKLAALKNLNPNLADEIADIQSVTAQLAAIGAADPTA